MPVRSGLSADSTPQDYKKVGADAAKRDFTAASGQGWEYDPDAMKAQIKRLEDLRDGPLWRMSQYADQLTGIKPPGGETVSKEFVEVANAAGHSHNTQFERYQQYLDAYIETLYEIDRAYQEQDQAALDALRGKDV